MANVSADRRTAARILLRVSDGAFASRLLGKISSAGVRTRVLGVLRHMRRLDATLATALKQPIEKLDPEVAIALRIGVFEVAVLGVPAPVAGDGAVHLVRGLGKGRASGLVNAVMRRAPQRWGRADASDDLGLRFSHPDWLYRRWLRAWGREAVEEAFAAAQQPAPTWVWFGSETAEAQIREEGIELVPHPWVPRAWRAEGNQLVAALEERRAYAQDPASQLVADIAVSLGAPDGSLLDFCAAPGGKTARAAMFGSWGLVLACDRHLGRLGLAQRLFAATGVSAPLLVQDGERPAMSTNSWGVVLLDAPCTGSGTLRRHPELRWRLKSDDINDRVAIQRTLIERAVEMVEPGGVLLYSTCSVEPEENEEHFVKTPSGFEVLDLEVHLPQGTPFVPTPAGGVLLRPQELCDGFAMHAVRRLN